MPVDSVIPLLSKDITEKRFVLKFWYKNVLYRIMKNWKETNKQP